MNDEPANDHQQSSCTYAWSPGCVVKTFQGFVSGRQFIQTAEAVSAHPLFDDLVCIYNDFLAIDGHSIDAATYQRVSACRTGAMYTNPNYRVVFVAAEPTLTTLRHAIAGEDASVPFHPMLFSSLVASQLWFAQQPVRASFRHSRT